MQKWSMAKKKNNPPESQPQSETSDKHGDTAGDHPILGHRLTARDAGWRSPTTFVAPLTFTPIDPPEPLPKRRRRRR